MVKFDGVGCGGGVEDIDLIVRFGIEGQDVFHNSGVQVVGKMPGCKSVRICVHSGGSLNLVISSSMTLRFSRASLAM